MSITFLLHMSYICITCVLHMYYICKMYVILWYDICNTYVLHTYVLCLRLNFLTSIIIRCNAAAQLSPFQGPVLTPSILLKERTLVLISWIYQLNMILVFYN